MITTTDRMTTARHPRRARTPEMALPIATWEFSVGVYMTVKGFRTPVVTEPVATDVPAEPTATDVPAERRPGARLIR